MLIFGILLIAGALIDSLLTGLSLVDLLVLLSGLFMVLMKTPFGNKLFPAKTGVNLVLSKMIVVAASVAIVVVPLSFVKGKGSGRVLDAALMRSAELAESEEYDKALKVLDGFKNGEEIPELWMNKAAIYIRKGESREAESLIGKAAAYRNMDGVLLFNTGLCYFKEEHYSDAANFFAAAVLADPDMWQGYYYAGEAFYRKKNYRSAEYFFRETVECAPGNAEVYCKLAQIKMDIMEFDNAKKILDEARRFEINEELEKKIIELEEQISYYTQKAQAK